jgi:hypothetical protein
MSTTQTPETALSPEILKENSEPTAPPTQLEAPLPKEIGGRGGAEPTRFGDWEKNGRCIDF